jgi:NTP pyrophosphatase (non-canonical NTP hydrolase)
MSTTIPKDGSAPGKKKPGVVKADDKTDFQVQAEICRQDSFEWFPQVANNLVHQTLAMAGEVGEVANIVKKLERGDLNLRDASTKIALVNELTDTYIYLLNIAGMLNLDLSRTFYQIRSKNSIRFGKGVR